MATALHTLARQGELLRLEWRDVDLRGRTLTIRPESAKNGKSRVVPLNSAVLAVLAELDGRRAVRAMDKRDRVFRLTRWTLRTEWAALKQATGLKMRFHDLRHSGACLFAQAGMSGQELMRIGGWRSWKMVERYTRRAPRQSATELLAHIAAG